MRLPWLDSHPQLTRAAAYSRASGRVRWLTVARMKIIRAGYEIRSFFKCWQCIAWLGI